MKISIMKFNIAIIITVSLLIGCAGTPNQINITTSQGVCVQLSQYNSTAQARILPPLLSIINSNPQPNQPSPYCMAVTLQNNNRGINANNIQINGSGLQLTAVTPLGNTNATTTLYDPAATGLTINSASQTVGNLVLFDPYNCATTSGSNVRTLLANGGNCTFYLQLFAESSPVGVYPYTMIYNYTNGNANYSNTLNFNQRVTLYGSSNQGLYTVTNNVISAATQATTAPLTWNKLMNFSSAIQFMTSDNYGSIYFAVNNQVYQYNNMNIIPLGAESQINAPITSLAIDTANNLYVASGNGLWVYNRNSNQFNQITDTNQQLTESITIRGLRATRTSQSGNYTLYAITSNNVYGCEFVNSNTQNSNTQNSNTQCTSLSESLPLNLTTNINNSFDVDMSGNLYLGGSVDNQLAIAQLSNLTTLTIYKFESVPSVESDTIIGGVAWNTAPVESSSIFFGVNYSPATTESNLSAVYQCSSYNCQALLSNTESNILSGSVNTVTTDTLGNVYVAGVNNLNSLDWSESNPNINSVAGAYLLFNQSESLGNGNWIPIIVNPPSLPIVFTTLIVKSSLTTN
jgi:hypothetical protein